MKRQHIGMGRKGGSKKSEAKTRAARENAKKGGRPVDPLDARIALSGESKGIAAVNALVRYAAKMHQQRNALLKAIGAHFAARKAWLDADKPDDDPEMEALREAAVNAEVALRETVVLCETPE